MNSGEQSSNAPVIISAQNLFCERDDRVLFQDLSFELAAGEVMRVAGSNGSGKTTLLRMICGLNDHYEGKIQWCGEDGSDEWEDFLGSLLYIGHRTGVNKVLTPVENLRWSCGLQYQVEDSAIYAALAEVGLRGFEESQCFTLSAGQQQRVSLARLLVCPARLWILDEPFTTLDAEGVAWLEERIQQQAASGGSAMVTTHHPLTLPHLKTLDLG